MIDAEYFISCYIYLSSVFRSVWTTTELLFVSVGCGDEVTEGEGAKAPAEGKGNMQSQRQRGKSHEQQQPGGHIWNFGPLQTP